MHAGPCFRRGGRWSSYHLLGCTSLSPAWSNDRRILGPTGPGERHMFSKINHVAIVNHVAMRTLRPAEVADFFRNVFELAPTNKKSDDPNHYLTDGHVTLVIMPWDITDYEGTGIITPGMDHIGFKVENIDAFKQDVERIAADN